MDASSSYNDTHSLCGASGPSASSLFFLLPPCIILLAIDMAIRNSHRPSPSIAAEENRSSMIVDPLRGLASKAQHILNDFGEVECQLLKQQQLSLELRRCRTLPHRTYRDSGLESSFRSTQHHHLLFSESKQAISPAFTGLCERLLEANRVWKQGKEIKSLKRSIRVSREARGSAAFKAFCDELLLSNEVWKKQREIDELKEERERMKRSRVGAITRAAKQMVLDAQKERLVEEFVKDVLEEAAGSRQAMVDLRREHEREVEVMAGEWRKEQRQMRREMECLHLAHEAKAVEQEISNELEDRLFEQVHAKADAEDTEDQYAQEIEFGYASDGDTYLEDMSCSSTCVGTPPATRLYESGSPLPRRRVDTAKFAGFSFNPLFFGASEGSGRVRANSSPSKPLMSPVYVSPMRSRKDSAARPTPFKTCWRV